VRNICGIFIVSGFWHGANWTFIVWGVLNAVYFLPLLLLRKNRDNIETAAQGRVWPTSREFLGMVFTFALTVLAWIFFRSPSIGFAIDYIIKIFTDFHFEVPVLVIRVVFLLSLISVFMLIEWSGRENKYAIEYFGFSVKPFFRRGFYCILGLIILYFAGAEQQFIYFQF
jgi:D-alanyl-lipoteichoic acid acyltransferase DltB (MBOAT superfamily)